MRVDARAGAGGDQGRGGVFGHDAGSFQFHSATQFITPVDIDVLLASAKVSDSAAGGRFYTVEAAARTLVVDALSRAVV